MNENLNPFEQRLRQVIAACETPADPRVLRRFALWCVSQTRLEAPGPRRLLADVRRALDEGRDEDVPGLRSEFGGTAAAAATVGLTHRAPSASAFLALWSSADPDPVEAAVQAALHSARWHADTVAHELETRLAPRPE